MKENKSNYCEALFSAILTESIGYVAFVEKKSLKKELRGRETYLFSKKIVDEVAIALQKELGISDEEGMQYKKAALKSLENIEILPAQEEICIDTENKMRKGGILHNVLILCKRQGVYPYYTSCLYAAALYFEAQSKQSHINHKMLQSGLWSTVTELLGCECEPGIVFMIKKAFNTILSNHLFIQDEKKIDIIKTAFEEGFKNEAIYRGCSQCLIKSFLTVVNQTGEKAEFLFKAASLLAGGVAGCNDGACGAYSGAMMIISTIVGRELHDLDDVNAIIDGRGNEIGRKLRDNFIETYGSVICSNIHKKIFGRTFDFMKEEDTEALEAAGAHTEKCTVVVGMTNAWLCEELYDQGLLANFSLE